jgi:farnesol dehydrogenase
MKFLLTGSNGYIGNHLATALLNNGHKVHALIYTGTDGSALSEKGAEVFVGDIRDYKSVERAARGCDAVFHLASYVGLWARDPGVFYEVNVRGTQTLLNACRNLGIKRVLVSSSCGIFGPSDHGGIVDEKRNNFDKLSDPYDVSKFHQVEIAKNFLDDGIEVVFVYPTRVFGPGIESDGNSLTRIFEGVLDGSWKFMLGNGKNMGNYVYVKDVVKGILLVMDHGKTGEGYILGGYNFTYNFLFEMLQYLTGRQLQLISIPAFGLRLAGRICEIVARWTGKKPFITGHAAKKFTSDWKVSTRKIRQLGFRPPPISKALKCTLGSIRGEMPVDMLQTEM